MPTWPELLMILGPLADILPREAGLVVVGIVALAATMVCGHAIRACRPRRFVLGWLVVVAGCLALQAGFASLEAYGAQAVSPGPAPWSWDGLVGLVQSDALVLAAAAAVMLVVPIGLMRRSARSIDVGALTVSLESRRRGRG